MSRNVLNTYSTATFIFDAEARSFSVDASTLGWSPGHTFNRAQLQSAKTGDKMIFYLLTISPECSTYAGTIRPDGSRDWITLHVYNT